MKVIGIGLHKTGTSTLGEALLILNYSVLGARLDMTDYLENHDLETPLQLASNFDALQDVPWAILYKELDKRFPNSKFILTLREDKKWLNSAVKHFGGMDIDMHKWIYGTGEISGNEKIYLEYYKKHNESVIQYFKDRPNDLLIVNWEEGDGWSQLCTHLDKPIPKKAFPHSNKGKHNFNWKDKLIQLVRNILPKSIRKKRVEILEKWGLHESRNRFNNHNKNKIYNKSKNAE